MYAPIVRFVVAFVYSSKPEITWVEALISIPYLGLMLMTLLSSAGVEALLLTHDAPILPGHPEPNLVKVADCAARPPVSARPTAEIVRAFFKIEIPFESG